MNCGIFMKPLNCSQQWNSCINIKLSVVEKLCDTFHLICLVYFSLVLYTQEAACMKIHAELPDVLSANAQPLNTKVYPTWEKYLSAFLSKGACLCLCIRLSYIILSIYSHASMSSFYPTHFIHCHFCHQVVSSRLAHPLRVLPPSLSTCWSRPMAPSPW